MVHTTFYVVVQARCSLRIYLGMNGNDSVILKFHHKYLFWRSHWSWIASNPYNGILSWWYISVRPAAKSRGQSNVNVFLKKPMPLIQNGIVKKSTMCLILCNIHVRLAIRDNPDQIVKGKGHWPISYNKRYLYVLVVSRTNHREREIYLAIP